MTEVSAESVALAINAANDLREEFGEDPLGDKLPLTSGLYAGDARMCVLAKAFNFDCIIAPGQYMSRFNTRIPGVKIASWYARFNEAAHAVKLNDALHPGDDAPEVLTQDRVSAGRPPEEHERMWYVELPAGIAAIALAFDAGELDHEYMAARS